MTQEEIAKLFAAAEAESNEPSAPRGRKKKAKEEAPKEITPEVISERAAAQIIGRAQTRAAKILQQSKDDIMAVVAQHAIWNLERNYKLIWTGSNMLKIFPDGSKELEVPRGIRGKAIQDVWSILFNREDA